MKLYGGEDYRLKHLPLASNDEWDSFLSQTYSDMQFFFNSITHYGANEYLYFGDIQKNLFYVSDNMRTAFGFDRNIVPDLLNKWRAFVHGKAGLERYDRAMDEIISKKMDLHDLRYQVEDKDGNVFWIRCCGSLKWNEDRTRPLFFSGRISRQDEQFTVDPVTNFPTNDTLQRHLIQLQEKHEHFLAIGFCLNHISQFNKKYGRTMGDRLLRYISRSLMDRLAYKMTFYRLPGVRCFALVDPSVEENKESLIAQIRETVEDCYAEQSIGLDHPCSLAVMEFPQPDLDPEDFLENMVSLLKIAHMDRTAPFIENSPEDLERLHRIANLEIGISNNVLQDMHNFRAVVQPIVSVETGKIMAGETLMRWRYEGKEMSPEVFIPIMEKNDLIQTAGRWIFEEAVRICSRIVSYIPDFYLSVNVSLQQLSDKGLLDYIPRIMEQYHLEGRHIVLEMTESCMDRDQTQLKALMKVCMERGIRFALDDFGTGYSSLRVLMKYPTSIIKLDRSLLLEMIQSEDKSNFINSLVYACHQFGKKVCMEGVETEQQRSLVQDASCDMIQGFYYYRPTEEAELYRIVEQQSGALCE